MRLTLEILASKFQIKYLQRKSRKEIGEIKNKIRNDLKKNPQSNELRNLYHHFFFVTNSIPELLPGLTEVDLVNLKLRKNDIYNFGLFADIHIGFTDIFHLISAKRLGCKYFFTLDSDFLRAVTEIEKTFQIEIITDIDKMINLIKNNSSS